MKFQKMLKLLIHRNKKILILIFLSFLIKYNFSQKINDLNYISIKLTKDSVQYFSIRNVKLIENKNKSYIAKYNPVSLCLKGMMYVYQKIISPQLSTDCIYEISCSNYSKELIKNYGFIKGTFCTADRLLRCNRISMKDIHPLSINDKTHKVIEKVDIYKLHDIK